MSKRHTAIIALDYQALATKGRTHSGDVRGDISLDRRSKDALGMCTEEKRKRFLFFTLLLITIRTILSYEPDHNLNEQKYVI